MTLPSDTVGAAGKDPGPDPETPTQPEMASPPDDTPVALQREPLHFVVILLLIADVIFGLGLAVFAEKVLEYHPMAIMGCGLAALGLGVLGYFVLVGGGKSSRW